MLCNEELNYENHIEKFIGDKNAVFLTSPIVDFLKYRIKVIKFLFTLKQDYFRNFHLN